MMLVKKVIPPRDRPPVRRIDLRPTASRKPSSLVKVIHRPYDWQIDGDVD